MDDNELKKNIRESLKNKTSKTIKTILGELTFGEEIGEGANGIVFSAEIYEREVAVKILTSEDKKKLARFKSEYLFPNFLPVNKFIVKTLFYDELEQGKFPAIIMKKYQGKLKRPSEPMPPDFQTFITHLLKACAFIHEHGIIHRDLKPENILVSNEGIVLSDFGIASYHEDNFPARPVETEKGDRLANYEFSSPEQRYKINPPPHPTMDIYAIGQIALWYVSGKTHHGVSSSLLAKTPNNGWSVYEPILSKCLAQEEKERYQTCEEILKDLESLASSVLEEEKKMHPISGHFRPFTQCLKKTFPKHSETIVRVDDPKLIDTLLQNLSGLENILFINDGISYEHINIRKVDNYRWRLGDLETRVKSARVHVSNKFHLEWCLLELGGLESNHEVSDDSPHRYVYLIDDKYFISSNEFYNGYAEINGEVIALSEHKSESYLINRLDSWAFVGTFYSNISGKDCDHKIRDFLKQKKIKELDDKAFHSFNSAIAPFKNRELERYL